jgi:hypothetical protein
MKNLIILLCLLSFSIIHSQIVDIEYWDGEEVTGTYYKDLNNHLNQFEGTYKYTTGSEEFTLVLKKFVNNYNSVYYQDLLAGEIKYVKNGIIIFDNLNKINQNLANKFLHDICGNSVIKSFDRPLCDDCIINQKRVKLIFFGRNNNQRGGNMVLQKIIEHSQPQKIKIKIFYSNFVQVEGDAERLDPIIPSGEYTLIKQP